MRFSTDMILSAIVSLLFIIGVMLAVNIGYFLGRRSRNLTRVFKELPSEDNFIKEERSASKRNWLAISRNLILFLIVILLTGGGIYYYFLQKGVDTSSIEEEQTDNPASNPDEIPTSSNQGQKEENISNWGNYTNTTYSYSLRHPKEFVITPTDDTGSTIRISPPESTSLWLRVEVQSNPDQLPSGAYASKFPPEEEVKKRANLIIAGVSSVRLETEKDSTTYVANGPKVIIFKLPLINSLDDESKDLTNLKRIITTLRFE